MSIRLSLSKDVRERSGGNFLGSLLLAPENATKMCSTHDN